MSAHVLMADGDRRVAARSLLSRLVAGGKVNGDLPDINYSNERTTAVLDPDHENLIADFESIGFTRRRDEDSI